MSEQQATQDNAEDGNYLLSERNYVYMEYLNEMKQFIMSEKYDSDTKVTTPRFDFLSFIAKDMLIIPYDNQSLTERFKARNIPQTAFTDFENIWIHVDFLKEIIEADEKEQKDGVLFLILHEIEHNALQHNVRLREFPHKLANWAEDMMMNINIQENYHSVKPSTPLFCGIGFTQEEKEQYTGMSDYDIAASKMKELMEEMEKQKGNGPGSGQGQGQGNGESPSQGQGGGGSPTLEDLLDDLKPEGNGSGDHLNDDVQDIIDALNEAGLGDYVDSLGLPKDEEAAKARNERIQGKLIKSIQDGERHYRENGLRIPGGHFNDYMREKINKLKQPKALWRMQLTKNVYGTGRGYRYTNDVPNNIYYVDAKPLGVTNQIYTGSRMPATKTGLALILIDSSGSMSNKNLGEAMGAVFELVSGARGRGDVPAVLVAFMDTTMRGEPFEVNRDNWKKVMADFESGKKGVDGRGGTDLAHDMAVALECPMVKRAIKKYGKIKTLTVITDLGDSPPQLEDFPKGLPANVTFLAVPGTYNDSFAKGVRKYAQVIDMGQPALNIDLSKPSTPSRAALKI